MKIIHEPIFDREYGDWLGYRFGDMDVVTYRLNTPYGRRRLAGAVLAVLAEPMERFL